MCSYQNQSKFLHFGRTEYFKDMTLFLCSFREIVSKSNGYFTCTWVSYCITNLLTSGLRMGNSSLVTSSNSFGRSKVKGIPSIDCLRIWESNAVCSFHGLTSAYFCISSNRFATKGNSRVVGISL